VITYSARESRDPNRVLNRAFAAGAALCAAMFAVTGIFVAKIAHSTAATTRQGTAVTSTDEGGLNTNGGTGGGQLSVPQQGQQPQGGSNGS
jgi:hypothetical protein